MSLSRQYHPPNVQSNITAGYWAAFRKDVFTLLSKGYSRLEYGRINRHYRKIDQMPRHLCVLKWFPIKSDAHEEAITGELVRIIEEMLNDTESPDWYDHYSIHEDPRIHSPDKFGKHRRRLDIRIEHNRLRPRTHYEFEAKRLCKGKSEVANYIGKEGLGLFLSGEYGRQWPEAGMLGYIQSDEPNHWAEKLSRKLSDGLDEPWESLSIVEGLPTFKTCHNRSEGLPPIRIFHALLNFC